MILLDAVVANTTGAAKDMPPKGNDYKGKKRMLWVVGTLGGGTLKLQVSKDGTNFYDLIGLTIPSDNQVGVVEFWAPYVRADLSGSAGANVTVELD